MQLCKGQTGVVVGIQDVLFSQRSAYQHVQVWETDILGRMMTLDGIIMFTEHDEFVYHEMLAHPALCLLGHAPRVLIVGGGDGGALREVLRHAGVQAVDLVEIDELVIQAARRYFPAFGGSFDDPRVRIHVCDGIQFVRGASVEMYDLVIVDSTDPHGFAEGLFAPPFYQACARLLKPGGVFVTLSESPFDPAYHHLVGKVHRDLETCFPVVETYLAYIPTYQMGMWSFAFASKRAHPVHDFDPAQAARLLQPFATQLRYYNPDVHRAAFALPNFVRQLIDESYLST